MVNLIKISNPDLLSIQITASFVSWRQYSNIRCYFCLQRLILHAQFGKFLGALYLYDSVTIWVCYAKIVDRVLTQCTTQRHVLNMYNIYTILPEKCKTTWLLNNTKPVTLQSAMISIIMPRKGFLGVFWVFGFFWNV